MYTKIKYIVSIVILLSACYACNNEGDEVVGEIVPDGLELRFGVVSDNIRNYTDIYVFNGQAPNEDYFNHKVLNVIREDDLLKMDMLVGKWNFVLVGCSDMDIRSKLISPAIAIPQARPGLPMWRTIPSGGLLPDVPEIRTGLKDGYTIVQDGTHKTEVSLDRNVAKVRVVLADGVGFKTGAGHTFSLKNVPTTLAWNGSLYPLRDSPEVASAPMTKAVSFSDSETQGHQKSDTIDFIIPAHRSTSLTDISTHKITFAVDFITAGGTHFIKEIEVPTAPKNNVIMLLNVTAKGGVEVKVDIKEWATVYSSNSLDMYTLESVSNTGTLATFSMNMKQERNWWVTLEDADNFEFVDGNATFGQLTTLPMDIQVRRKTAGVAMSTKLNLYISGFDGLREQYDIANLTQ